MVGRAQLLPCQTWYNSEHNWIFFSSALPPLPFLNPLTTTCRWYSAMSWSLNIFWFSFLCSLHTLSGWVLKCGLGVLLTAQIFMAASLLLHLISATNFFIVCSLKSGVSVKIWKPREEELLWESPSWWSGWKCQSLWGRKDEVKCGRATWRIL